MKKNVNQQSIIANQSTEKEWYINFRGQHLTVSEDVYRAYKRPFWAEDKQKERAKQCLISDGKGNVVRCTETECTKCEFYRNGGTPNGNVVSLDRLYEEAQVEPEDPSSMEDITIYAVIFEELLKALCEIKPKYARIFELLYHGYNSREIAETLDMPNSTVKDDIRKLRKIVQEFNLIKGIF